jgi:hypothetical protein
MIGRLASLLRMQKPNPDAVTGLLFAHGDTVPVDASTGYETGCIFQHIDGAAESAFYVNEGDVTSCDFNAIVPAGTAEIADLGDVGTVAYTAGSILVADGDSYEEVAASGDATLASTGAVTVKSVSGSAVASAEHGAGAIGTGVAPVTRRYTVDGTIVTETKIDLTGLASVATANDVIGLSTGGVAFIGRNVVANNGIIYKAELICLETPAGGDNDVNVVAAASGTLEYDGAGGTAYGVDGGDAVAGQVIQDLVQGLTADHYFYLTAGTGDTAAAYTAGQFIFRTYGHALLA